MAGNKVMSQQPTNQAAQSSGAEAVINLQPASTISETLRWAEDRQIDVSVGVIKRLKMFGLKHYNDCVKSGAMSAASYWDGYMRALSHVLEAEHE
jgi:hypothetical protein